MSSKKIDTRSRILNATWKLMEGNQGEGTRMSDIAKATGISRQALYLHFDARADLLIATTRYADEVSGIEKALEPSRNAATGRERLDAYIVAVGTHFQKIQGLARAISAIKESDAEVQAAWEERLAATRHGCLAAIEMLAGEGNLADEWEVEIATDLLCLSLSFQSWDQLVNVNGWSVAEYIEFVQKQATSSFLKR